MTTVHTTEIEMCCKRTCRQ